VQSVVKLDSFSAESESDSEKVSYALDIVSLNKAFRRHTLARGGYTTFKSFFLGMLFRSKSKGARYTKAIRDLTMRIPRGASVGVIGRNGSGKSTLLKLITGIYKPDSGKISLNGRVAALIELGAGFHPDFTGRENLYLGGIMHGLTRQQIDQRFAQIVEFSELGDVIDDPVRTYSSGMFMRLGFSLAVHTDPDILMVDEVLAVGDAAFVAKCKDKIASLRKEGKTLILVTHDLDSVERWCDEVLWLDAGEVKDRGDPRRVIDHYRQFVEKGEELSLLAQQNEEARLSEPGVERQSGRWGSREIEITEVKLNDRSGQERLVFHPDDEALITIKYRVREAVSDFVFGIAIHRTDGVLMHGSNTEIERVKLPELGVEGIVSYKIKRLGLVDAAYWLDVAVHRKDGYPFDYRKSVVEFKVRSAVNYVGVFAPEHEWSMVSKP